MTAETGPSTRWWACASSDVGACSGRGLWIAHQLDLDVALTVADDGFTVRLRADAS